MPDSVGELQHDPILEVRARKLIENRLRRPGLVSRERRLQKHAHVLRGALYGPILLGQLQGTQRVVLNMKGETGFLAPICPAAALIEGSETARHLLDIGLRPRRVQRNFRIHLP